jgi:homoserine dehydrogenase
MSDALRIGVAGLGTVGASVLRILRDKAEMLTRQCGKQVTVTAVSARDRTRDRGVDLGGIEWFDDPIELAKSANIDVFVELIGGDEGAARSAVEAALRAGHHVVTANKALLAKHGVALAKIAEDKGVLLNFEAAVAGGIPVKRVFRLKIASRMRSVSVMPKLIRPLTLKATIRRINLRCSQALHLAPRLQPTTFILKA